MKSILIELFVALLLVSVAGATRLCPNACLSTTTLRTARFPPVYLACPAGDTGSLSDQGFAIDIRIGWPAGGQPGIPAEDIWLIPCGGGLLTFCSVASAVADAVTDVDGRTVISNSGIIGGGCANGIAVNYLFDDGTRFPPLLCSVCDLEVCAGGQGSCPHCMDLIVRSPDIDGNLLVNLVDFSAFASSFVFAYEECCDFDANGVINLQDLSTFALHFGPPGHGCQ